MFFRSIKFRLTIWYVAILAVLLVFFGFISFFLLANHLYQSLDNSLRTRANEISAQGIVVQNPLQSQLGELVLVYDSQKNPVFTSGPQLDTTTINLLFNNAESGSNSIISAATTDGQKVHLFTLQVVPPPFGAPRATPSETLVLVVGRSLNEVTSALDGFQQVILIGGLVTLVLAAGGGMFLASRALKPVDDINKTAHSIEESDLSRRIEVKTRDELGRLATTLNDMIGRLEKAFERQRQFTADASHELRTPLSVIEAEATLSLSRPREPEEYQKSLESITQEVSYMSSVLEKLLMLARADAGKEHLNLDSINLKELIVNLVPDFELIAGEKGLRFELGPMTDLVVKGDEIKLRQLILNLLDNAVKYTPQGTVSISLIQKDKFALIEVTDTGSGIPQEHIPRIFERFYRVDKARSRSEHGTGLGLAISKYIAEAHGGKIEVTSQVGKGSTFFVSLPLQMS